MGPGKDAHFGHDRANLIERAAIDTHFGLDDRATHDALLQNLEAGAHFQRINIAAFRGEFCHDLFFGRSNHFLAGHLVSFFVSCAQALFGQTVNLALKLRQILRRNIARFFGATLSQVDDGVHHGLHLLVAIHHSAEHHVFRQLFGFGFHHENRVLRAGNNQIKVAVFHVVQCWVEDVFAVNHANACCANGAHERDARERQRC